MDRVLKLAAPTPAGLGAVTASGGVAGTLEQLTLREFTRERHGPEPAGNAAALALPGAAQGMPRSAAYKGSLVLNGQTLEGSIDATLDGPARHHGRPCGRPCSISTRSAAAAHAPRGAGARPAGAPPAKPIDTAPLRSLDGSLQACRRRR